MIAGLFLIFELSPIELIDDMSHFFSKKRNESLKSKVLAVTKVRKKKGIRYIVTETKDILRLSGRESTFFMLLVLSLILSVLGMFIAISINNMTLIPILSIGFSLLPFWYVKLIASKWKNELNAELETALSVITTSYIRTDSIITAIEENIDYLNPPVESIFREFLLDSKLINSNIKMALGKLSRKIDSDVFSEWVDTIIACQEDRTLKVTITPVISKLSDMRIVSGELNNILYEPVKEFLMMMVLVIFNVPLLYFLNKDWYNTLMHTTIGKGVLSLSVVVVLIGISGVIKYSKPVEYRG
jgi:Flp pilus assembly protein TadB